MPYILLLAIGTLTSVACIYLSKSKNFEYYIMIALFLSVFTAMVAPTDNLDLYRYYQIIDNYRIMSFGEYINNFMYLLEPLFNITLFLGSKLFTNNFIASIYCFAGYLILFYIIYDYTKLRKTDIKVIIFVFISINLLFIFTHYMTGIRNTFAMLIFSLALYLEFFKNKTGWKYKILYVIPIFFHMSLLIGLFLRILMNFDFKKTKYIFIGFVVLFSTLPMFIEYGAGLLSKISFFYDMYAKVIGYTKYPAMIFESPYYFFRLLLIIIFIIIYFVMAGKLKNKYYNALFFMLCLTLGSVVYEVFFARFCVFSIILAIPMLVEYFSNYKGTKTLKFILPIYIITCLAFGYLQLDLVTDLYFIA